VLVLVIVIVCAAEVNPTSVSANVRPLGESEIVGTPPVPVRATPCGEPVALSVATRLAVATPVAVGLNSIDSVQLAPGANKVKQVFPVSRNELALAPVKV
jgi:hypothetical protein